MPWMTCEKVYQSEMCCEFSELWTTPCHSLMEPHVHQGTRPISSSMAAAEMTMASARKAVRRQEPGNSAVQRGEPAWHVHGEFPAGGHLPHRHAPTVAIGTAHALDPVHEVRLPFPVDGAPPCVDDAHFARSAVVARDADACEPIQ